MRAVLLRQGILLPRLKGIVRKRHCESPVCIGGIGLARALALLLKGKVHPVQLYVGIAAVLVHFAQHKADAAAELRGFTCRYAVGLRIADLYAHIRVRGRGAGIHLVRVKLYRKCLCIDLSRFQQRSLISHRPVRLTCLCVDRAVAAFRCVGRASVLQRLGQVVRNSYIALDIIADGIQDNVFQLPNAAADVVHGAIVARICRDISGRVVRGKAIARVRTQRIDRRKGVKRRRVVDAARAQCARLMEIGQIDDHRVSGRRLRRPRKRQRIGYARRMTSGSCPVSCQIVLHIIVGA